MKTNKINIGSESISFYHNEESTCNDSVTLLLLHGGTLNGASMLPLGQLLTKYNLIIPDLMAHGESKGCICTSIEEHADILEHFIDELDSHGYLTEKVILVGYCLSGTIALEIGRRRNARVSGLVILAGGAKLASESAIHTALSGYTSDSFNYLQVFRTGKPNLENLTDKHLEIIQALEPTEVCYYDLQAVVNYNRQYDMSNIEAPTLLVSGDKDVTIPLYCTMKLRDTIPTSMLQVIPYVGHALLHSAIEAVANSIDSFVNYINS